MKIENLTELDKNNEGIGYSWHWKNDNNEERLIEIWSGEIIELTGDICREFKEKWGESLKFMINQGVIKVHEYDLC